MAKYEFYGYSPDALTSDPDTNSFTLDADYNSTEDRNWFEIHDNDNYFDGDAGRDERGEDRDQSGKVFDANGDTIANGKIYVEQVAVIEAPDGSRITLDRIEVDGELVGYVPSEPLEPGVQYSYVGGYDVDDRSANGDTRQTYDYYAQNSVPCFGPGTMIATQNGEIPVEWLDTSDKVLTRDHGFQPILWIGRTKLPRRYFGEFPSDLPICIPAGALAGNAPSHDLHVTGDHRLLLRDARAELMYTSSEVFAPAKAWLDAGIARIVRPQVSYTLTHILCASHEVIMAQGAWVETMFPGKEALRRLSKKDYSILRNLLGKELDCGCTARPCLSRREAALLLPSQTRARDSHNVRRVRSA